MNKKHIHIKKQTQHVIKLCILNNYTIAFGYLNKFDLIKGQFNAWLDSRTLPVDIERLKETNH